MKILFSNLGYLRGISGSLAHHTLFAHRHFFCSAAVHNQVWNQLAAIVRAHHPDLCCFVEIEQASFHTSNRNNLQDIGGEPYDYFDIENKYGQQSYLRRFKMTRGKCNAFISKKDYTFEKLYFVHGTKRLIYKLQLAPQLTLFFAHFSLKKNIRAQQLLEARQLLQDTPGEAIFLGDFNILEGFSELAPLLQEGSFLLLNNQEHSTFRFGRINKVLDICICSRTLASRAVLQVIPQPFSDHAALLMEIKVK